YWSALKKAFRAFDSNLKMPPVLPRLSFTYVTNRIEKLLKETVLDPKYVLDHGVDTVRMNWLLSQQSPPIETLFNETKQQMEQIHLPLRQLAQSVSTDLEEEAQKNLRFIQKHLAHLQQKTKKKLAEKYEQKLAHYDEIGISLKPNQLLQERVWSPLPFFNEYGIDFLHELLEVQSISFNSNHYLVYLD
ncbi:MAG TPA: bacillithiol biosynthesis BshC, partial [Pseudogracilibacillus sp.]|nr:bacillithiol biosynthesis BshC [Pseudogracilibacillus sp.]